MTKKIGLCGFYTIETEEDRSVQLDLTLRPRTLDDIEKSSEWIKNYLGKRLTINQNQHTYAIKHVMEDHIGLNVADGIFILAALCAGLRARPDPQRPSTALINYSSRVLRKKLKKEVPRVEHY